MVKGEREGETWQRVCLAVTLSEARGAEQPNYDLRPVPWSPNGSSIPPFHRPVMKKLRPGANNEHWGEETTHPHRGGHTGVRSQIQTTVLSFLNEHKGAQGRFLKAFTAFSCVTTRLGQGGADECEKDNRLLGGQVLREISVNVKGSAKVPIWHKCEEFFSTLFDWCVWKKIRAATERFICEGHMWKNVLRLLNEKKPESKIRILSSKSQTQNFEFKSESQYFEFRVTILILKLEFQGKKISEFRKKNRKSKIKSIWILRNKTLTHRSSQNSEEKNVNPKG